MRRIRWSLRFKMTTLALLCVSEWGCEANSTFRFDRDGIVQSRAKASEVTDAEQMLMQFKPGSHVPNDMLGGFVFDGVVTKLRIDDNHRRIVTFSIRKILLNDNDASNRIAAIVVIEPSLEYGGIDFKVDMLYRVFTVKLNGLYQTWDATGTSLLAGGK